MLDLVGAGLPSDWDIAVEPGSADLRLASGSAAIHAGATLPNLNDGVTIVGNPDMGAFEYGFALPEYGPRLEGVGSRFIDVPAGTLFFTEIEWIADQAITKGCNPPLNDRYCPNANVTRGQMAAFLARALNLPLRAQTRSPTTTAPSSKPTSKPSPPPESPKAATHQPTTATAPTPTSPADKWQPSSPEPSTSPRRDTRHIHRRQRHRLRSQHRSHRRRRNHQRLQPTSQRPLLPQRQRHPRTNGSLPLPGAVAVRSLLTLALLAAVVVPLGPRRRRSRPQHRDL